MSKKEEVPLTEAQELASKYFLDILKTKEDLKNWVYTYLDIILPFGVVESSSNSSVGDAIYAGYEAYRDDMYVSTPGFIYLSSRDSGKTLGGSILNVLLLLHFKADIAHFAAQKKQAEKCIEYTAGFMKKINPYIKYHGRKIVSDSKSKIQIENEDQSISFIDVIVATLAGGNSQRANFASFDEIDTLSPQGLVGYREAQLIPTRKFGRGPLTVKYSTRKFSAGIFAKEIQNISKTGEKLLTWNLLDITEKCQDSRSLKPQGRNSTRYVKKRLPFRLYSQEEFDEAGEIEKHDLKKIELYDGCLKCPIAAVCHGNLANRPDSDVYSRKGLLKTIDFTIGQFKKTSTDMAEAQLLNWKASSKGMVYPKFSDENIISLSKAYEMIMGEEKQVTFQELIEVMIQAECQFYGGVDWGFTHNAALSIVGVLPSGHSIFVDMLAVPGLETHEFCEAAIPFQEKYGVKAWYCDNSQPAAIKTFKRTVGARCPEFKKDVAAGIDSVRGQLVTTSGNRKLFVLDVQQNEFMIDGFRSHHFTVDATGEPTKHRADDEWADIMDGVRYIGQNIYATKGGKPIMTISDANSKPAKAPVSRSEQAQTYTTQAEKESAIANANLMKDKIANLASEGSAGGTVQKKGGLFWSL